MQTHALEGNRYIKRGILCLVVIVCLCALISPCGWAYAQSASVDRGADGEWVYGEGVYVNEDVVTTDQVVVSAQGEAAAIPGDTFAVSDFSRAQKGSNRDIDGVNMGYTYYVGSSNDYAAALSLSDYVLVYIPEQNKVLCDPQNPAHQLSLKSYFCALDAVSVNGGIVFREDVPWMFTSEPQVTIAGVTYSFAVQAQEGRYYVSIQGPGESDTALDQVQESALQPTHADFLKIVPSDQAAIVENATGFAALWNFLTGVDLSPLWVTLKTTGVAIVFIFILGLLAAFFSLSIPKRAQDIADTIFTIPMVLPPTVCGFLLLLALGNNSAFGRWLQDIGIKLTFSWEATVIAAVVVAFPLMYRSARGAFENLDANMLDAARTLGWSNWRIFFRLMLPLSWSSIAAGTVLAFARALGEFGATLFLAGNYAGITRTIPIAIYFEWMSGNLEVAVFWTVIIIIFSFIVILFINLWSTHTTKYRKRAVSSSSSRKDEPERGSSSFDAGAPTAGESVSS